MRKHLSRADALGIRAYLADEKKRQQGRDANRPAYLAAMNKLVVCCDCGQMVRLGDMMAGRRCRPCDRGLACQVWERTEAARTQREQERAQDTLR